MPNLTEKIIAALITDMLPPNQGHYIPPAIIDEQVRIYAIQVRRQLEDYAATFVE